MSPWPAASVAVGDVVTASQLNLLPIQIADSTAGTAVSSFDFTSLPGQFGHLLIVAYLRGDTAATNTTILLRANNDSGANYNAEQLASANTTVSGVGLAAQTSVNLGSCPASTAPSNEFSVTSATLSAYANTSNFKPLTGLTWLETADTAAGQTIYYTGGVWKSSSAITRVTILPGAGNFVAGSRATIYGLA